MKKAITIIAACIIAATQLGAQTYEWARNFGGTNKDYGYSVAVDASGNVYTTGYFEGTADFDPGSGTDNHSSNGSFDVFIQKMDANGNFLWAKTFGSTDRDQSYSIAVDANGNVYITGSFAGTVDFDPGSGTDNHTSNGALDIFVEKLDANGNFLWAKTFGGASYNEDVGNSIAVDANGNVYVTGWFSDDTTDFDPGNGTDYHASNGGADIFVLKLDANGNFQWAKTFGSREWDRGYGITVDNSANVYIVGSFLYTVNFNQGAGTDNHTSSGGFDVFVQKLDTDGNYLWTKTFGGTDDDNGKAIVVDASGNIFVTGDFSGTVDFDPGTGTDNHSSSGEYDIFIQKLDANGNFLWAKTIGGSDWDFGADIAVDANSNVYTVGYYKSSSVDFDPGSSSDIHSSNGGYDIFIQILDANGNFVWANTFGAGAYDYGRGITVDPTANIYTTGYFKNTVDFDPGTGTDNLTSNGETDIFVHKMSQTTTGFANNTIEPQISVFPNPTKGLVSINLDTEYKNISVTITDITGRIVKTVNFNKTQQFSLSLDNPAGIYFIEVNTGEKKTVVKLLKE